MNAETQATSSTASLIAAIGAIPAPDSGTLKHIGGSQSDVWNDRVGAETVEATPQLACETRDQKIDAVLQGLAGIAPRDELEAMMAAQLIAAHAAAMECYRGGATAESFAQRREYLNQATRLSRAFVALINALQRRRDRAEKAALVASGARNAKSAKQPAQARPPAVAHQEFAKQPSAAAPAPTSAEFAKQPPVPLAPDLPAHAAQMARAATAMLSAESAKQPSAAAGPAIVRPRPRPRGEGTAAALPFVRSEPAGELIKFAKQPSGPIIAAPALGPRPLALTYRTPGVRRAALIARLMEGTSLRIAE